MAIRDDLRANAQALLHPGETIQSIFPALTVSPYFSLISYANIILRRAHRVVVVTDQRVLICTSGRFRMSPVRAVTNELPRRISVGPAHGLFWYKTDALGEALYVNRRFYKDVAAADGAMASSIGT